MDATTFAGTQNTCENLVNQVKNSNLNFLIFSETPYSVNICIKKRFIKEFSSSNFPAHQEINALSNNSVKSNLIDENKMLKLQIERLKAEKESNKEVIEMLEGKMEKAESEVYTHFTETKKAKEALEKVTEDASVLKNVINNLNKEASKNKNEITQFSKVIKAKNKEIYNLECKALNQQDTITNIKEKIKELKKEKTQIEKEVKTMKQKHDKKHGIKDKNQNLNMDNVDKETQVEISFDCEVCEKTFKNRTTLNAHIKVNHDKMSNPFCNHVRQCVARNPKSPLPRKWKNGDGMTVCLPNIAFKSNIEKYETDFGDHTCEDCNQESIIFENGSMYRVKSCGNNLVKFENMEWWLEKGTSRTEINKWLHF